MKLKLIAILGFLGMTLGACSDPSGSHMVTAQETKDYYSTLSDNEVIRIFKEQNKSRCLAEFNSNSLPNTESLCDCILSQTINQIPINDIRQLILPSSELSSQERQQLDNQSASVIVSAVMNCAR